MVVHSCPKCFKEFKMYSSFIKHTEHKIKPCNFKENLKCENCDKIFTRKTNLKKHMEKCNLTKNFFKNSINGDNNNVTNGNNNNISHITNNININFQIADHGTEDFGCIDLTNVLDSGTIILKIIEEIHCNPKHPQYQNILITDRSRSNANVFKENKWTVESKNAIMQSVISRTYLYLEELKTKLVEKYKEKVQNEIQTFIYNQFDVQYLENSRKLKQDINNVIYENKKMIKETKKKHEDAKKLREAKYFVQNETVSSSDSDSS